MASNVVDTLGQLVEARNEARAVLAELHGTVKDARQLQKELDLLIPREVVKTINEAVNAYLTEHLARTVRAMDKRMDARAAKTLVQWDRLTESLGRATDLVVSSLRDGAVTIENLRDAVAGDLTARTWLTDHGIDLGGGERD